MDAQEQPPTAVRRQVLCGCSWLTEVALQAHQRSVLNVRVRGPPWQYEWNGSCKRTEKFLMCFQ